MEEEREGGARTNENNTTDVCQMPQPCIIALDEAIVVLDKSRAVGHSAWFATHRFLTTTDIQKVKSINLFYITASKA